MQNNVKQKYLSHQIKSKYNPCKKANVYNTDASLDPDITEEICELYDKLSVSKDEFESDEFFLKLKTNFFVITIGRPTSKM